MAFSASDPFDLAGRLSGEEQAIATAAEQFAEGARITVWLTLIAGSAGIVVGVLGGLGKLSKFPPLSWLRKHQRRPPLQRPTQQPRRPDQLSLLVKRYTALRVKQSPLSSRSTAQTLSSTPGPPRQLCPQPH